MFILAETYVELVEHIEDCLHREVVAADYHDVALVLANVVVNALGVRVHEPFVSVE